MKKSVLAILLGVFLGIMMMVGVIAVLNMKPDNEEMMAQGQEETQMENLFEEVFLTEDLELIEEVTEVEESKSEETNSEKKEKPQVDYPYYIRVNRQANCVTVYSKDENGEYTIPVKAMTCSVGLTGETPLGVTKITARYYWRPLFGGTYGQYTVRFNGHILFHSVPYTQTTKDSLKEGQYNLLGEPASQGCVRLSVADAKWIFDNCRNGTSVEVYESPDPGPLGKPATYKISDSSPYRGWDPTDPDPANPWWQGSVSLTGIQDITVNQGDFVDLLSGVSGWDVDGLPLSVEVNSVDSSVPGVYTLNYSTTGVLGMTATASATLTVQAVEQEDAQVPEDTELPVNPENPNHPEDPNQPGYPNEPEYPNQPEYPDEPEYPNEPENPNGPEYPNEPENPNGPEYPNQPEYPDEPEYPNEPENPNQPEYPGEPELPDNTEIPIEAEMPLINKIKYINFAN